ncbi:ABC transporter ATP-binding protein [Streptomyces sp. NPDC005538]|uniref:ABC transporter ATP-binding protein n=1 Tax=unclassified Streptomyces TaxID=2593676 RepID=UPI0033ACE49B
MRTRAEDDPGAAATRALLRSALRDSGPRCAALCVVSTAATAAALALPAVLGRTLDLLLAHAPAGRWVGACAGLVLLTALLDACGTVLGGTVTAGSTAWLRSLVGGHVLAVGPRAGTRFGSGELVARLVGNAAQAGTAPGAFAALLAALAGPVGGVVALALIDPWLAAVFLAGAPVLALLLRALARDTTECVTRYQRAQGLIAAALAEAIDGSRTIRAAGTADRETARILRPLPDLSRAGHRMWRVQGRAAAQAVTVAPLLQLAVVAVAGCLLTTHRLTVGDVLAAARYAVLATGVGVLVGQLAGLMRARAATGRLAEILTEPAPTYGHHQLPLGEGQLELRGVTARRGGRPVLDGIDLVVPGGTTLAVVGRSGAGKSLLAAVAGRLTDPDEGEVLLDGIPLRDLCHSDLRGAIGYAFDRPVLLGTTIEDTIAFGVPTPSPTTVRAAARTAQVDTFIRRLPHSYATPCAEAPHSGGEAQRLGLARAFAHPGRLLILDDALSSLDTVTEHHLTKALTDPTTPGTRLLVAHRAATAARADRVLWLDGGRVRAVGTHAELWETPGYRAVFGGGDEGVPAGVRKGGARALGGTANSGSDGVRELHGTEDEPGVTTGMAPMASGGDGVRAPRRTESGSER